MVVLTFCITYNQINQLKDMLIIMKPINENKFKKKLRNIIREKKTK